jgi:hypothetical protein
MYVVEIEDRDTGKKKHKAFMVSRDAVEYWSEIAAPYADDDQPEIVCKIFKAKTNDTGEAVALVEAGKAEFFDFGGFQANLREIVDRLERDNASEKQIEAEAAKLAENPAVMALARKRVKQRNK